MDRETFYPKLIQALLHSDFRFRASDLSQEDLYTDRDELASFVRMATQSAPSIFGAIHPVFDQEAVQQRLTKLREYAAVSCFKYVLAQPVIVAVVEADQLAHEEIIKLANRFDEVISEMLEFTGKMGGIKLGGIQLGGTRLSATGFMLLVFFDHTLASSFIEITQKRCKIHHFWKKTWVLPWVVDVSNRIIVSSHAGFLPESLSAGVLSRVYLQKEIFQEPEVRTDYP